MRTKLRHLFFLLLINLFSFSGFAATQGGNTSCVCSSAADNECYHTELVRPGGARQTLQQCEAICANMSVGQCGEGKIRCHGCVAIGSGRNTHYQCRAWCQDCENTSRCQLRFERRKSESSEEQNTTEHKNISASESEE